MTPEEDFYDKFVDEDNDFVIEYILGKTLWDWIEEQISQAKEFGFQAGCDFIDNKYHNTQNLEKDQ